MIRKIVQKWVLWFGFLMMPVFWLPVQADLTIQIDSSNQNAMPIALVPFSWKANGGTERVSPVNFTQVIGADLYRSGKFKAIAESDLPAKPTRTDEIDYSRWKAAGLDNLLMGEVTALGNGYYKVEMRFVDVLRQQEVLAKRWDRVHAKLLRQVAHKVSDDIYQELTGIQGAFSTQIAYVTVRKTQEGKVYQLEVADADGFNSRPILKSKRPIMSPSWSPDGKNLAYVSFENGRSQIFVQSLDGQYREMIADFKGINGAPAWGPKGEKMALTLSKDGSADIYLMDMKTRKLERLTNNWAIETEAVWGPGGHTLFYNSDRRGQPQIFQVFLDTLEERRISFDGRYNSNPAVSPDGRYIAMVNGGDGGYHIGLLDLYTHEFNIVTNTRLDEAPSFSPNGEMVLYAMNQRGTAKLAVVSVDRSTTQILSVNNGEVRSPSWGPFVASE